MRLFSESAIYKTGGVASLSKAMPVGPQSSRPSTRFGLRVMGNAFKGLNAAAGWPISRDGLEFSVTCARLARPPRHNQHTIEYRIFSFMGIEGWRTRKRFIRG